MTYNDFFKFKGWKEEDVKHIFKGYWSDDFFNNHFENYLCKDITNFEVFCEYPFWKLNQIYNMYYNKDNKIGSTYDWLSETATDDIIEQYLGKEND